MSYEKQTWTTGEVITAEKLNHMEDGIVNNDTVIVTITSTQGVISADKTYEEILDAINNGKYVYLKEHPENAPDGLFIIYNLNQITPSMSESSPAQLEFSHTIYSILSNNITRIRTVSIILASNGTIASVSGNKDFT